MRITRKNMHRLSVALERLYDINLGEENVGFWLENQQDGGTDVQQARFEVTQRLTRMRAACQAVIDAIDERAATARTAPGATDGQEVR